MFSLYGYIICNEFNTFVILFIGVGLSPSAQLNARLRQQLQVTGKPGFTMALSPCPNPCGLIWVGRRGLNNPYGFWLLWLFNLLFLMSIITLA